MNLHEKGSEFLTRGFRPSQNLLETVVPTMGITIRTDTRTQRAQTHASTQHRKRNSAEPPTSGTWLSASETTTLVTTMTPRYADVASE